MSTPRKTTLPTEAPKFRLKLFGIGGAGCNALAHIATAKLNGVELIGVNTDLQKLAGVTIAEKFQIGSNVTHGLGAGGEAEVGARAALQDAERIEAIVH